MDPLIARRRLALWYVRHGFEHAACALDEILRERDLYGLLIELERQP